MASAPCRTTRHSCHRPIAGPWPPTSAHCSSVSARVSTMCRRSAVRISTSRRRRPAKRRRRLTDVDVTQTVPAAQFDSLRTKALYAGILGVVGCAAGFVLDPGNAFRARLIALLLFLGIALGSMALMMIQHLSGGAWGVFRRIFEASSR